MRCCVKAARVAPPFGKCTKARVPTMTAGNDLPTSVLAEAGEAVGEGVRRGRKIEFCVSAEGEGVKEIGAGKCGF